MASRSRTPTRSRRRRAASGRRPAGCAPVASAAAGDKACAVRRPREGGAPHALVAGRSREGGGGRGNGGGRARGSHRHGMCTCDGCTFRVSRAKWELLGSVVLRVSALPSPFHEASADEERGIHLSESKKDEKELLSGFDDDEG
eukprot:4425824-Prymnesium_polylepis.1